MIRYTIIAYALLLIIGGVIGHQVAGSLPSLIASVVSGILVLAALFLFEKAPYIGSICIYLLLAFLTCFFLYRFSLSNKFLPAGLLALITLLTLVIVFVSNLRNVSK